LSLFTPNTKSLNSFFAKAKFLMAWRISLAFCFVFSSLTILFIDSTEILTVTAIMLSLTIGCLFYLKITKNYNPVFWSFTIVGTILIHYSLNEIHIYSHFVDFFWIMCIILLAFIGLGKKIGFVLIIINTIGIAYFYIVSLNVHIEAIQPRTSLELVRDMIEVFLSLFCITYLLHQYITFNNYFGSELKKINIELSKKNEENIILVKEIHHRVKNNLQIIISLLRLQKGDLKSDEAKRHFNEAINRIMVMSLIHKKLYQENEMAHIEIKPYLNDLSLDVINISNMGLPIQFNIESEIDKIGLKTIVPLGLLINELLLNSIKHAFSDKTEGIININILNNHQGVDLKLIYSDNGQWIEPPKNYTGFGLGLIQTLSEQLEGSFKRNQSEYCFTIKNLDT
jgi:two-component sensor histidine kinase